MEPGKQNTGEINNSAETREQLPKPVYLVESPNDDSVLVGINVAVIENDEGKTVAWFDTNRERRMKAAEVQQKDDYFAFRRDESEGGGEYYFAPMTVQLYDEKVKDKIANGIDFKNDQELYEAFIKTMQDAE